MSLLRSLGPLGRVISVALLVLSPKLARAEPPTPAQCSDAFEESQRLSKKGKLQASMEQLVICGQPSCPQFLARECSSSYETTRMRLPTVNLQARDAEHRPLADVTVSMDGAKLVDRIAGVGLLVDPGLHEFVFEGAGFKPATVRIVIAEGQKNQPVVATLEPVPVAPPPPTFKAALPPAPPPHKGIPTATYVLGGIGVAALATGTIFRVIGSSDYSDLESRCGHACPPNDVDPVKTKFTISTIGFGVGAAALVAAGVVFVIGGDDHPKDDHARSGLSLRASCTGSGAAAFLEGSFSN